MTSFEELLRYHVYINLDERNDRMILCENELKKIGVSKPQRFSAIKNKRGNVGCSLSHLKCLENARDDNLPYICIFEDDVVISKPNQLKNVVNRILEQGVQWDVMLLAGNIFKPHKLVTDDYIVVNRSYTTGAYIVKQSYYDTLITNLREGLTLLIKTQASNYSIDVHWMKLQQRDTFIIVNPLSVYQRPDYSNIEDKVVNYKHLMLSSDK